MKIALGIEYDGTHFYGWQRQQAVPSIQQSVETSLSEIANHSIDVFCAGRTDAGVHATGQVIHFETTSQRELSAWTLGLNSRLPKSICVRWAKSVNEDFHARFSATARRYRYIIYNSPLRSAILNSEITHIHLPLDSEKMHQAGQFLLGEHDFSSFRAAQCQSHSPCRNVHHIIVKRVGDYIVIDIQANAFVHHMVRNIVGSLCEVGYGNRPKEWMLELLESKDRTKAAVTGKPNGLYLVSVTYPEHFDIPKVNLGPLCFD